MSEINEAAVTNEVVPVVTSEAAVTNEVPTPTRQEISVNPQITLDLAQALIEKHTLPFFEAEVKTQLSNIGNAFKEGRLAMEDYIRAHFGLLGHVLVHGHVVFAIENLTKFIDQKVKEGMSATEAFENAMSHFIGKINGEEDEPRETNDNTPNTVSASSEFAINVPDINESGKVSASGT